MRVENVQNCLSLELLDRLLEGTGEFGKGSAKLVI